MKLISINNGGDIEYINPHYVKRVKQTHSDMNGDWCIVITMYDGKVDTILSKTEEESNSIMIEIGEAMESIC